MNIVLPIKSLYATQREDPLGAILRWQYNQYEDILDFDFTDSGAASDYYGLAGDALVGGGDCYPSNARIYVFRQDNSPVEVGAINNYFFGLAQHKINAWMMEHDIMGTLPSRRFDKHRVFRSGTYYYAFVIKDLDTGYISDIVYANISIN